MNSKTIDQITTELKALRRRFRGMLSRKGGDVDHLRINDGLTLPDQTANFVYAGPASGGDDTPAFRALVAADIQTISGITWTQSHIFGAGLSISSGQMITMAEDTVIGIGSGLERIVFNGGSGAIAMMGCYLGIGTATPDKGIQLAGTDGNAATFNMDRYQSGSGAPPSMSFRKSRNAAVGGLTIVQSGDTIGRIYFRGCDGVTMNRNAAYIDCVVDGTPGAADMPGKLQFFTTPNGSGTSLERLAIDNAGNVGIGTSSPDTRLDIAAGALTFAEMTAPPPPAANGCALYIEDNGAGKTRLMALFATGAAQQLAIQP